MSSRKKNVQKEVHRKSRVKRSQERKRVKKPAFQREEFEGKVCMGREGYAFIEVEGMEKDIFVPAHRLRGALNGDWVKGMTTKVKGFEKDGSPRRIEGEVIALLKRSGRPHIGILQVTRKEVWLIMESRVMPYDISLPVSELDEWFGKGKWRREEVSGLKAAAVVVDWPRKAPAPIGKLVDVLGAPGANDTEMHAILTEFGLPYRFEKEVEEAAEAISAKITEKDLKGRRDFRKVTTFTIDPADAKDFDDALSLRRMENGNVEVGVHIADVTYYVTPGSVIDKCAYERGTSVYLVDRTVPMLPEKLSNNLCSLRPGEDKLCFSAVFELDHSGKVLDRWFGRTVICSDRRFNYEEAQAIIESGKGDLSAEVLEAYRLADLLRKKRFAAGAISFERPEMKVEVDADGKPLRVYEKVSREANWLIEEFMLLANRSVAESIGKVGRGAKAKTFVYRVHEEPNPEKLDVLSRFVKIFGYHFSAGAPEDQGKGKKGTAGRKGEAPAQSAPRRSGKKVAAELNGLLDEVRNKPEQDAVVMMALRTMARARYTTENLGHYGLAFDYYTHFTSPIRRYPDMMVHRLLSMYLEEMSSQNQDFYEACCVHASEREQIATDAERASIKYKLCEYMQDKVGQIYPGTVSGLTEWGMYVEIEPEKVEGMVALREIPEDYYEFDEESYSIVGKGKGRRFTMGDKVWVKVIRASLEQKLIDYQLVEGPAASEPEQ